MKDNRQIIFLVGIIVGALLCVVGFSLFLQDCRFKAKAAAAAAATENAAQSAQIATCTNDLSHQNIRINNMTSGWTLIYDRQERPSLQVFNGLGQIGLGAATPQNVGLRFAIRYSVPVTVAGDPQGAQVVYYNNATRGFSEPYPPVSFETAWATR